MTLLQPAESQTEVRLPPIGLPGSLQVPLDTTGIVIFAHGSGSSRLSPRNRMVAKALNSHGFATLLFDLLRPAEEEANQRAKVFDIPLLADRLVGAVEWIKTRRELCDLPVGLFGASTGAAAALVAASQLGPTVRAVVSRGGRPDLAADALATVTSPTLLIVGDADFAVIELNQRAYAMLSCIKQLIVVPGATHLFAEPGALEQVIAHGARWFSRFLNAMCDNSQE